MARESDENSLSQIRFCKSALTPADGRPSALQMAAKILFSIGLALDEAKERVRIEVTTAHRGHF